MKSLVVLELLCPCVVGALQRSLKSKTRTRPGTTIIPQYIDEFLERICCSKETRDQSVARASQYSGKTAFWLAWSAGSISKFL